MGNSRKKEYEKGHFKSIPYILEHPKLILKSKTVGGAVVVLAEHKDANGKPIMVSLMLNPVSRTGYSLSGMKITNAYGKDFPQNLIEEGNVLWVDPNKKRPKLG